MEQSIQPSETPVAPPPKRRTGRFAFGVGIIILSAAVSSVFGAVFGFVASRDISDEVASFFHTEEKQEQGTSVPSASSQALTDEENTVIGVVKQATPSVVSIIVSKDVPQYRSPFDFFFNTPDQSPPSGGAEKQKIGGGTGFFVTADGMILTNKHVVSDESADYTVILQDGTEKEARVLARDSVRDAAVIKIDISDAPVLSLGDSDALEVGQTVIAIGNSLGEFSNSVSRGIVSGLGRDIVAGSGFGQSEHLAGIIQTDAAINPGNSGGPLLDIQGRVVGMNTAVAQGAENVGFALPINIVKKTVDQVRETGRISTPYLGVRYAIIDEEIQKANNLPFDYGALVLRGESRTDLAVVPGSPADKAGIVENDIILEINGKKVTEENTLSEILSDFSVGDSAELTVWHRGEEKSVEVVLEER